MRSKASFIGSAPITLVPTDQSAAQVKATLVAIYCIILMQRWRSAWRCWVA